MEDKENIVEDVEFNEELYKKNLKENTFAEIDEKDGVGEEVQENANN